LYAAAEAHANTTIKQQKAFNTQAAATAQREHVVVEQELKLREKEEQGELRLERELEALTSHKTTIVAERKNLDVIPHSKKEGTKPPYVCPGCSNHTYSNNMITRFHVQ
jgi:hypothetical protein